LTSRRVRLAGPCSPPASRTVTSPAKTATVSPEGSSIRSCPSAPMPEASPLSTGSSRGGPDSTVTRRPASTSRSRSPARTASSSTALQRSVNRVSSWASNGARARSQPSTARKEVGRGLCRHSDARGPCPAGRRAISASGSLFTLSPMPATAHSMRSGSMEPSNRTPHTFLFPRSTSLGHLIPTKPSRPAMDSRTSATANAPARERRCARAGSTAGRSRTEKVRSFPGPLTQVRPRRPRPPVCSSVTTTVPAGDEAAIRFSTWLVEAQAGT